MATVIGSSSSPSLQPQAANLPGEDRLWINLRKQAKYVVIGGTLCWYFQTALHWRDVLDTGRTEARFGRILAGVSLLLLVLSVTLFATLMLLPLRGSPPNFAAWQQDPHLKRLIPLLTSSLVGGFTTLFLTLSPIFAPPPPSTSLATRLTDASRAAGGNLQAASKGIQSLVTEIASSVGLGFNPSSPSSSQTYLASLKSSDLLEKLRLTSAQGLASRLGVSSGRAEEFTVLLDEYQERAKIWAEGGARYAGWAGAVGGAVGVYLLVLGVVGLLGVFTTPLSKRAKKDGKGKAAEVTDVSPTSTPIPKPVRNLRPHDAAPNAPLTPFTVYLKLAVFSLLMFILPLTTYYLAVGRLGSAWAGGLAALAANIVLVGYIVAAFLEEGEAGATDRPGQGQGQGQGQRLKRE